MMLARTTSAVGGVVLVLSSIGCSWPEQSTTSSIPSSDAAADDAMLAEPSSTSITASSNPAVVDTTNAATVRDEPVPGLTTDEIDELGERWLVALSQPQNPDLVVFVSPALASTLDDALASFSASVAPINADPNPITDATAPDTLAYIASNCPDQGVLAGNDIVGD